MNNKYKKLLVVFVFVIIILLMFFSNLTKQGVARGLIISTNVIIPSLFPFMVCVMIIIKYKFEYKNKVLNIILSRLFGHNFNMFFTFLLSMLGGYPIGAKMINELYNQKTINEQTANIMLMYCVNAGPAFIVCVVGDILGSKKLGVVLLIAHLLSSVLIALFYSFKIKKETYITKKADITSQSFSKNIVDSVNDATKSVIGICSFIVLFSVITTYFDYFLSKLPILNNISAFLEITTSLYKIQNYYFVSFLLGFSGVSIWCQIFSLSCSFKLDIGRFIKGRTLHGLISVFITKIILSIFKIKVSTFSNNVNFIKDYMYSNVTLMVSMGVMIVFLMIFIYTKNNSGKIIDDVI